MDSLGILHFAGACVSPDVVRAVVVDLFTRTPPLLFANQHVQHRSYRAMLFIAIALPIWALLYIPSVIVHTLSGLGSVTRQLTLSTFAYGEHTIILDARHCHWTRDSEERSIVSCFTDATLTPTFSTNVPLASASVATPASDVQISPPASAASTTPYSTRRLLPALEAADQAVSQSSKALAIDRFDFGIKDTGLSVQAATSANYNAPLYINSDSGEKPTLSELLQAFRRWVEVLLDDALISVIFLGLLRRFARRHCGHRDTALRVGLSRRQIRRIIRSAPRTEQAWQWQYTRSLKLVNAAPGQLTLCAASFLPPSLAWSSPLIALLMPALPNQLALLAPVTMAFATTPAILTPSFMSTHMSKLLAIVTQLPKSFTLDPLLLDRLQRAPLQPFSSNALVRRHSRALAFRAVVLIGAIRVNVLLQIFEHYCAMFWQSTAVLPSEDGVLTGSGHVAFRLLSLFNIITPLMEDIAPQVFETLPSRVPHLSLASSLSIRVYLHNLIVETLASPTATRLLITLPGVSDSMDFPTGLARTSSITSIIDVSLLLPVASPVARNSLLLAPSSPTPTSSTVSPIALVYARRLIKAGCCLASPRPPPMPRHQQLSSLVVAASALDMPSIMPSLLSPGKKRVAYIAPRWWQQQNGNEGAGVPEQEGQNIVEQGQTRTGTVRGQQQDIVEEAQPDEIAPLNTMASLSTPGESPSPSSAVVAPTMPENLLEADEPAPISDLAVAAARVIQFADGRSPVMVTKTGVYAFPWRLPSPPIPRANSPTESSTSASSFAVPWHAEKEEEVDVQLDDSCGASESSASGYCGQHSVDASLPELQACPSNDAAPSAVDARPSPPAAAEATYDSAVPSESRRTAAQTASHDSHLALRALLSDLQASGPASQPPPILSHQPLPMVEHAYANRADHQVLYAGPYQQRPDSFESDVVAGQPFYELPPNVWVAAPGAPDREEPMQVIAPHLDMISPVAPMLFGPSPAIAPGYWQPTMPAMQPVAPPQAQYPSMTALPSPMPVDIFAAHGVPPPLAHMDAEMHWSLSIFHMPLQVDSSGNITGLLCRALYDLGLPRTDFFAKVHQVKKARSLTSRGQVVVYERACALRLMLELPAALGRVFNVPAKRFSLEWTDRDHTRLAPFRRRQDRRARR